MESWGRSALFLQEEHWLFGNVFTSMKIRSLIKYLRVSHILLCYAVFIYQFIMSYFVKGLWNIRKKPSHLKIIIKWITWIIQESPVLKPDWSQDKAIVKSLVIVIGVHVVKIYNNYASTLIFHKVNRNFPFLPLIYFP